METPADSQAGQSSSLDEKPEISPPRQDKRTRDTNQKETNMDGVLEKPEQKPVGTHQSDSPRNLTADLQGLNLRTLSSDSAESSELESFPPQTNWSQQPLQPQPSLPTPSSASGTTPINPPSTSSGTQVNIPPSIPKPTTYIPKPTQDYILTTSLPPHRSTSPTMKLLILDLNGTLLYRPRNPAIDRDSDMLQASMTPTLRPHLQEFMSYIFKHFKVMFWSSATPRNVNSMITATTTPEQRAKIIATWARDTLGLSPEEYNKKSITFKDLQKVFADKDIRKASQGEEGWDVGSTILLDDSVIKASFQLYNHVCVPEFVGGDQDDALWQVTGYLEELRYQSHVARFIKQNPFKLGDGWNGMCMGLV